MRHLSARLHSGSQSRRPRYGECLFSRRVTLNLGFGGRHRDVTMEIPNDEPTPWQWGERLWVVGQPSPRVDRPLKATGAAHYTYDIELPGMLYGAILRSPWPHARVRDIDLSGAQNLAGVRAVLALDDREIRFAGQEVAAVAAITSDIAADALKLIEVDYETQPFVVEMDDAAKDSAPRVFGGGTIVGRTSSSSIGEVAKGLGVAASTIEATYTTAVQTMSASRRTARSRASMRRATSLRSGARRRAFFPCATIWRCTSPCRPTTCASFANTSAAAWDRNSARRRNYGRDAVGQGGRRPVKVMLPRGDKSRSTGNRPNSEPKVRLGVNRDGR